MVDLLVHESTHQKAVRAYEELGLYVGIVSHEDALDDGMPVSNERGDIILFFSGETFFDPAVEYDLITNGHSFKQGSASFLVHLYEEKEDAFFQDLNGWFCGVLIDRRQKRTFLFNDRYGMKRLYFSERRGRFRFSTEAKALLHTEKKGQCFDEQGLIERIACGCPLENRSLFKGISLLPGGSKWLIKDKSVFKKLKYFDFSSWESQKALSETVFYPKLRDTVIRILPRYMRPEQTVAMSLTGGFDTRIIMACADLEPRQILCYTFNGMYHDCYDVVVAREIASICGQEHRTITMDDIFLKEFRRYAEKTVWISEGMIDLSAAADLYMNEIVKEFSQVRLTGNYGSEVLRRSRLLGNVSYPSIIANPGLQNSIIQVKDLIDHLYRKHALTYTLLYEGPWHEYGRYSVESSQLVQRTPYTDNDLISLMYQAPPQATTDK